MSGEVLSDREIRLFAPAFIPSAQVCAADVRAAYAAAALGVEADVFDCMLQGGVGLGEGGIAAGCWGVGYVLAREDLEEGCSGDGGRRDDGPVLGCVVDGGVGVGEGVGEVGEERWVWGCCVGGGVVFVEGAVLDGDYWVG